MKKSYAAWAVLLIIALVASFLLGLTNEVTKDRIAQQQTAQAEKARQDLQPEADTFEALELAEGSGLSGLYEARKGGERIGLVATVLTQGFGGEVEVTAGFTNEAALTGISVGGANFAETPGLGAKAKDAAFTGQFQGKTPRLRLIKADGEKGDNTVDAITAATRTSTAVTNAVNTAGEYVKSVLGISDEEETVAIGSRSAKASAQGFGGMVAVNITLDDQDRISEMTVGDDEFAETEGIGARALEPETAQAFIGLTPPLSVGDVDVLTGATITKTALVDAVNKAAQMIRDAAGTPAVKVSEQGFGGLVAVTLTMDEAGKIAGLTIGDDEFAETEGIGARALEPEVAQAFIGLTPPLSVGDVDVLSGATITKTAIVNAINKGAAKLANAAAGAAEAPKEEPAAPAEEPAAEAPTEEPAAKAPAEIPEGAVTVQAKGLTGSFPVYIVLNEDGTVKSVTLGESDSNQDKPFLAMANTEEFLGQFAGKTAPVEVDVTAGATVSKTAIVAAVNEAAAQAKPAEAAPAEEPATEAPAEEPAAEAPAAVIPEGAVTVQAKGLTGSFPVYVVLNDDGTVKSVTLGESDSENDKSFLAMVNTEAFLSQFAGKTAPVEGIDAVTGATTSSNGIVAAVNEALASAAPTAEPEAPAEAPAEEPAEAPAAVIPEGAISVQAKGLTGSFPVYVVLNEDGTVKSVTLGESDSENDKSFLAMVNNETFLNQFAGKSAPVEGIDAVTGATTSSNGIVAAVNEALASAAPAAEPEAPAEAPAEEPAEAPAAVIPEGAISVQAKGLTGSFPVYVVLNEDGTVKSVTLGESDSENDKSFLAMVNTEAFLSQFAGKTAPVEGIDAVTGATTSSNGILAAVNEALASAAPTAEPEAPAEAPAEEPAEAPAKEPVTEAPAAEGITVQAKGLTGSFPVTVVLNDDGTIQSVTLGDSDSDQDKPFLAMVNNETFLGQFAGKSAPVEGIDAVTGATTSSNGIVAAVNEALASAAPAAEPEAPAEAPAEEPAEAPAEEPVTEAPAAEGITVQAKGVTGSFPVTVVLNDDGTIQSVTLGESDSDQDKPFLAMVNTEAFLSQFAGKSAPVEGIDAVTGATTSSNGIVAAVNEALASAAPAAEPEAPAKAPAEEPAEAPAAEGITVQAKGLTGSFPVTVVLNDDGTIKSVTLGESDSDQDKPFLAMVNNETFLGQFAGKSAPVEGIDAVTGATTSSNGIVAAVNEALAPAQ